MCATLALKLENYFREVHFDLYVYPFNTLSSLSPHKQNLHCRFLPVKVFQAYAHLAQVVIKHLAFFTLRPVMPQCW